MGNLALALLGGLLAAAPAQATPAKAAPAKAPAYDVKAEVTLTGVVDDLHESKLRADHPGLHLSVRTETDTVEVHTCPVAFMKDLDFGVEKGDTLTIVGSRPGGVGIVLAREIKKGQTSLTCRDKAGVPVWTR